MTERAMTFLDALPKSAELLEIWKDQYPKEYQGIIDLIPGEDSETDAKKDFANQFVGGPRLAAIKDMGPEAIDGLLILAHGQITGGQLEKARDTLQLVLMLDPYEDRAFYTYASTLQMEGKYSVAGVLYMQYIMMQAMEPRGYLRIGECLLGEGHETEAREYITGALSLATEAGDELTKQQAKTLLAELEQASNAIKMPKAH